MTCWKINFHFFSRNMSKSRTLRIIELFQLPCVHAIWKSRSQTLVHRRTSFDRTVSCPALYDISGFMIVTTGRVNMTTFHNKTVFIFYSFVVTEKMLIIKKRIWNTLFPHYIRQGEAGGLYMLSFVVFCLVNVISYFLWLIYPYSSRLLYWQGQRYAPLTRMDRVKMCLYPPQESTAKHSLCVFDTFHKSRGIFFPLYEHVMLIRFDSPWASWAAYSASGLGHKTIASTEKSEV